MKRTSIQAVLLFTFILSAHNIIADDWPVWRGPNRNSISNEKGWNPAALKSGAKIAWEANVGKGHSSVSVQGDKLYTLGNRDGTDVISCLNTKNGSIIWEQSYKCAEGNFPGPRSTPIIDGNNVYTFSRNAKAYCLNASSGKVIWNRDLIADDDAKEPRWGHASSPVIYNDLVIYNAGAHGIALNKKTGKTVWSSGKGNESYASAVVFQSGGKDLVAIFSGKAVNAVDPKTGKKVWSYPWTTSYDVHAADPIVDGNLMYISSGYKTGASLIDFSGSKPRQVWGIQAEMKNHFNTSVLIDGNLYGIAENTGKGKVTCMDFKTGTIKWSKGKGYEGLMAADGKLIIMDKAGDLTIAEVNPNKFVEISKAQILGSKPQNWTVPVLANGSIYCRKSTGRLVSIDVSK